MTTIECANCGRRINEDDGRTGYTVTSWSEPGSTFPACRFCVSGDTDEERAADEYWERRLQESREGIEDY